MRYCRRFYRIVRAEFERIVYAAVKPVLVELFAVTLFCRSELSALIRRRRIDGRDVHLIRYILYGRVEQRETYAERGIVVRAVLQILVD